MKIWGKKRLKWSVWTGQWVLIELHILGLEHRIDFFASHFICKFNDFVDLATQQFLYLFDCPQPPDIFHGGKTLWDRINWGRVWRLFHLAEDSVGNWKNYRKPIVHSSLRFKGRKHAKLFFRWVNKIFLFTNLVHGSYLWFMMIYQYVLDISESVIGYL